MFTSAVFDWLGASEWLKTEGFRPPRLLFSRLGCPSSPIHSVFMFTSVVLAHSVDDETRSVIDACWLLVPRLCWHFPWHHNLDQSFPGRTQRRPATRRRRHHAVGKPSATLKSVAPRRVAVVCQPVPGVRVEGE